jgi:hypothetical protein
MHFLTISLILYLRILMASMVIAVGGLKGKDFMDPGLLTIF